MCQKPWQVLIGLKKFGELFIRVREHTHGSVAFSGDAAIYCGGAAEIDIDGYIVRCNQENEVVEAAREIARMSEWKEPGQ